MNHLLEEKIKNIALKFGIESFRTQGNLLQILLSFLFKGLSLLCVFLIVPLSIDVLDQKQYGVWLTLSAFVGWFSFFDIGIGSALRNKFAENKARGKHLKTRAFVSIGYYTVISVSSILFVLFFFIDSLVDWYSIFNVTAHQVPNLNLLMQVILSLFCFQLVLNLIITLYIADQRPSIQSLFSFLSNALAIPMILLLKEVNSDSLLLYGAMISLLPIIVLVLLNIIGFSGPFRKYKPSLKFWKRSYLKSMINLSFSFFLLQIAWVTITSTDNMIITQLYSPDHVVPYNISIKLFSVPLIIFIVIATPFWSSFTEAHAKREIVWLKRSIKNLERFAFFFIVLVLIFFFIAPFIYDFWIGDKVTIDWKINGLVALFHGLIIYNTPYNFYINGRSKIRLHLIVTTCMAILNIPLSIVFSTTFEMGIYGILLSTVLCLIPVVVFTRTQYHRLINNTATGIWNK